MKKRKAALLVMVMFLMFGLLPAEYTWSNLINWNKQTPMQVQEQACGCPCPEVQIVRGTMQISSDLLKQYPLMHQREMNLIGNTPFAPYNYEVAHSAIFLTGQVVGVDTILCEKNGCELAPRFKVDTWRIDQYIPKVWVYGVNFLFVYVGIAVASVVTGILVIIKR